MKKRIVPILLVVALVCVGAFALVGCDKEEAPLIVYDYVITPQFTRTDVFDAGSLLYKPENPYFSNHVFNTGYGIACNGTVGDDMNFENPRMNPGFDVNKDYIFQGWYTEPEYIYKWDFSEDRIYHEMRLYAKWTERT